jgi:fumarate reductase subunit C
MAVRRPYVRSMEGWWRRNPFFLHYMAREMTAPLVALYALILLAGLVCLALGPVPYEAYVDALASPASLALHVLLIGVFVYHTFTWFQIMPKTMPPVIVRGSRISAATVTWSGIAGAAIGMAALWLVARALA